jgi:hypothetical protein
MVQVNNELMIRAAKFYSLHIGQRGTDKQVATILKNSGPLIVGIAVARGFKI